MPPMCATWRIPMVTHFFTSGARPAAPWGRGGAVRAPGGVMLETSDGRYDPAAGDFSETILKLSPNAARLMDSFAPSNWQDNLHARPVGLSQSGGVQLRR